MVVLVGFASGLGQLSQLKYSAGDQLNSTLVEAAKSASICKSSPRLRIISSGKSTDKPEGSGKVTSISVPHPAASSTVKV